MSSYGLAIEGGTVKIVMCRCRHCRAERRRPINQAVIKRRKRQVRNQTRMMLRRGEYDHLPKEAMVGYLA